MFRNSQLRCSNRPEPYGPSEIIAYARSRMRIAKFSLIYISSKEISLRTHHSSRSGKGVVFRTKCLFWGSTFGKWGGFPDGVPLWGATVRENEWIPERSIFLGSNRSGKRVVFRMECLFGEQPFGKMSGFPNGGFTAGRLPQRLCGLKGRCSADIRGVFRQVPIRSAGCLPQVGA